MALRVVFLGTPEAAVPALDALLASHHEVAAVVTPPDRPRGRGMTVAPSAVKRRAREAGIEVVELAGLRSREAREQLADARADVFAVAAYGKIVPSEILEMPRLGWINLHFSLLPRLRGAAPVQWALIEGHTSTGVTVMRMDEGLDTGPVLAQREEPILHEDTAGTLEARLARVGADLLVEVLDRLEAGGLTPRTQDASEATFAPKLTPADARIDWSLSAAEIANRVRAFDPRPGAWGMLGGRRLKVWRARVSAERPAGPPGTLRLDAGEKMVVEVGGGRLLLEEVQPEGGRRMSAAEFIRGHRPKTGDAIA